MYCVVLNSILFFTLFVPPTLGLRVIQITVYANIFAAKIQSKNPKHVNSTANLITFQLMFDLAYFSWIPIRIIIRMHHASIYIEHYIMLRHGALLKHYFMSCGAVASDIYLTLTVVHFGRMVFTLLINCIWMILLVF